MKKLAIGEDDFKVLRENDYYFVDKSHFVKDVIEDASRVLLFPRPRRFGKTLNLSMLRYFFDLENAKENRKLFERLTIQNDPVFKEYQGKYPVISLSLKSCKGIDYKEVMVQIKSVLGKTVLDTLKILDFEQISESSKKKLTDIKIENANEATLAQTLYVLSSVLHEQTGRKVIILIDEYDTPVHEAYLNGFYDEMVRFLKLLLGNALKGNEYLQKGILTGILRVSKESMFSDLNNVKVYSVLSKQYNDSFGFTQDEVNKILEDYELTDQESSVKDWYNGYYFGDKEIYNPWSILHFMDSKGEFHPYWLSTSANDLVQKLIKDSGNEVKQDIEDLLNNKGAVLSIEENISFPTLQANRESVLSFLVQTGYLKARRKELKNDILLYEVLIPNTELRRIYINTINYWFEQSIGSKHLKEMLQSLINGNIPVFEKIFSMFILETLSYFNVGRKTKEVERVFQAFLLGMLINLKDEYEVYSEKESGYGRFDVSVVPKDKTKQAIIMELKSIDTFNNETKEDTLNAALTQIEDRQYETLLRQQNCQHIMKLAVTFDGKRVWVKRG